jgi:hypothetical protein
MREVRVDTGTSFYEDYDSRHRALKREKRRSPRPDFSGCDCNCQRGNAGRHNPNLCIHRVCMSRTFADHLTWRWCRRVGIQPRGRCPVRSEPIYKDSIIRVENCLPARRRHQASLSRLYSYFLKTNATAPRAAAAAKPVKPLFLASQVAAA